jgi:hypothetical protein
VGAGRQVPAMGISCQPTVGLALWLSAGMVVTIPPVGVPAHWRHDRALAW